MVKADNPAGRLFLILYEAKDRAGKKGEAAHSIWAELLKAAPGSTELYSRLVDLNSLLDDAIYRVQKAGRETDAYKTHFGSLRQAISPAMHNAAWENVHGHITDGGLMSLSACSEVLSILDPDGEVPADKLGELQKKVEELINAFVESEEETEFVEFALRQLNRIRDAVLQYRIRGPEGLVEALERLIGSMVGSEDILANAKKTETDSYKAYGEVVSLFNKTIQFVEKFSPYAAAIMESAYLKLTE